MPVTLIKSSWSSGSLVFHESTSVAPSVTYDVLTIGTGAVKVGNTSNDVDFQYYGTGSLSAIIDCGAATFTLTGIGLVCGSTLGVTGAATLAGTNTLSGTNILSGPTYTAAITVGGTAIMSSGISVAGTATLQTVIVSSSIAIAAGGLCTLPQNTNATQFPSADPSVAGQLYVDGTTIKRSAG